MNYNITAHTLYDLLDKKHRRSITSFVNML